MPDASSATRVEPAPASGGPARPTQPEIVVPAPTPTSAPSTPASNGLDRPVGSEPMARIEDKVSRIEEKLARSENSMQRVVDRFEQASGRMSEVASQAELTAVRGEVSFIARQVRNVPGWSALVGSSVVTAILTAIVMLLLLRYFPGALGR